MLRSAIVMADLRGALARLKRATDPREFREAFSQFANLSQKLTAAMRTDFQAAGRGKWSAGWFTQWGPVTDLFKELRNIDTHEAELLLVADEQASYDLTHVMGRRVTIGIIGEDGDVDPLGQGPPIALVPATREGTPDYTRIIWPFARDSTYRIGRRSAQLRRCLDAIGDDDALRLARKCLDTLESYYAGFLLRLDSSTNGKA